MFFKQVDVFMIFARKKKKREKLKGIAREIFCNEEFVFNVTL